MLNHVLIPLDGSPLAEAALDEARRVMAAGGQITLVTVVQSPNVPIYGYELSTALVSSYRPALDEALAQARRYLDDIAEGLVKQGYQVHRFAEFGDDAAETIADKARSSHADAIIMSTHGRSGLSRLLLGSVAGKVLGLSPCPVYVIPSRAVEPAIMQ